MRRALTAALLLSNVIDTACTPVLLVRGATELNPLMASLLELSLWGFVVFKLVVVSGLILFLGARAPKWPLRTCAVTYAALACAHLWAVTR